MITPQVLAFEPFNVSNFKIKGLKRISKEAVLQEINLAKGEKITGKKAQEIINALYKTNFFSNIKLEKEQNTLIIDVIERPVIAKLEIIGIKSKDKINKILKTAEIVEGLAYNPDALHKAEREIEQHYFSQGKYGVEVNTKIKEEQRGRVFVTMTVNEGEEATIKEIKIIGNTKFKESVLLKQLFHGKTNLLSWYTKNNRYFKEKLDADLEILQSYYMDRGYINFQIDSTQASLTEDQKHVYITINITEGKEYHFGKINLSGQFVIPKIELEKIINKQLKSGAIFSRKLLLDTKKQIEDSLANIGYSKADIKLNFDTIESARTINIDIVVNPNQRIMVRKIIINGNHLTQDFVIRRMLPQIESTWISNQDVQEGKLQILRYGYASNVDILTHDVPEIPDQVDIEYKLEEQKTMQLQVGVGYTGGEGLGYHAGADIKNFVGTGKDIGFLFENNKVNTSYKFNYYDPYFNLDGIGFGYDLYFSKRNLSKRSNIFDYSTDNIGGNLTWSIPMSQYSAYLFGFGYNKTKLNIPAGIRPTQVSDFISKKGSKYNEYILNLGWKYNSLDKYIFPTTGLSQKADLRYNLPASKLKYYIISYESNWYKPLTESKKYIFNFASDLGYGGKYSNDIYPFFKNFFIGGADSLRGFEERSLGPKDSHGKPAGGNLLINFRTAVIFPVPFKPDLENIRPSVFMDFGQVYNVPKNDTKESSVFKLNNLRSSAGISVAIHTPLGVPIVLNFAQPLKIKSGDEKERFSFTFSANY